MSQALPARRAFQTPGFEDLEISTQIVAAAALARGCRVETLDRNAQLILIERDGRSEIVKEATKTGCDSYLSFLLMEDKRLTKLMLGRAGLRYPAGWAFNEAADAEAIFGEIAQAIVVKPATTNFGEGVVVFESKPSLSRYRAAVQESLRLSPTVIVEEFAPGPELRFLVIDGECVAVCNRVPANVCGDGQHSIAWLVQQKNQDPWRGTGHRSPLEKIQLGAVELEHLAQQGLNAESIPADGQCIYLRRNSNISTGGDSIDRSDDVHPGYNQIAVRAAAAVGARICGVDLILPAAELPPAQAGYHILELNFNPVLYIHEFPHQGPGRSVGPRVLDLLGFEAMASAG
ncbi:MAG: carboxylate--amine ligase [Leptospirales bacterium]|nr:carboxylate--amine ligase [Leptospirales bacterium]